MVAEKRSDRPSTDTPAETGERFLSALATGDFTGLAACLAHDVRFRSLVPGEIQETRDAAEAASFFRGWFGSGTLELLARTSEPLADRWHLGYRVRVTRDLGRQIVEQQGYATIRDGRILALDLVCSGFRPEEAPEMDLPHEAQAPDIAVAAVLEGGDANCATLTPLIRARLRELASGDVLEVVTSEPTAERDIVSWSNLTGNMLVAVHATGAARHFYLRKK